MPLYQMGGKQFGGKQSVTSLVIYKMKQFCKNKISFSHKAFYGGEDLSLILCRAV